MLLIRHLKTRGNYERRYIGRTDEGLYRVQQQPVANDLPRPEIVFASPMKRCLETAARIYPEYVPVVLEGVQEIDFGDFENKCYEELQHNPDYIRFIESNGKGVIPGGENITEFKQRCCCAFLDMVQQIEAGHRGMAALICHGGTIMAVMERFHEEQKSYYDYQIKNGSAYEIDYNPMTNQIKIIKEWNG